MVMPTLGPDGLGNVDHDDERIVSWKGKPVTFPWK